jgi:MFS family permease
MLQRQFGMSPARTGIDYGILVLVGGTIGVLSGPVIAGWFTRRGRTDALVLVPFCCTALLVPTAAALFFVTSYTQALVVGGIASVLYSVPQALASSALQLATPNRMRGMASALYVFAVSLSGLALAPTAIALVTDHVFADEGRVGASLGVTVMLACTVSALCLWRALVAYRLLPR